MADKSFNAFAMAQRQFDSVAEKLDLDQATRDLLRSPIREYSFSIPVKDLVPSPGFWILNFS